MCLSVRAQTDPYSAKLLGDHVCKLWLRKLLLPGERGAFEFSKSDKNSMCNLVMGMVLHFNFSAAEL